MQRLVDNVSGGLPTKKLLVAVLRMIFAAAVDGDLIGANPASRVRLPREARTEEPFTFLSREEIEALLSDRSLRALQRTAFTVAIYIGLRLGELAGLRWEDVRLGQRPELIVRCSYGTPTKSGKRRSRSRMPTATKAETRCGRCGSSSLRDRRPAET